MKLKKTFTCLLATCTMGLAILPACGGSTTTEEPPSADPDTLNVNVDTSVTAELEIMVPGGNQNERTMIQCLIDSFANIYPNVTISMSYVSVDNYVSAVQQQQLAGTLPDIVWSNSPDFYDLVESYTFEDLTPYITASEKTATVTSYLDAEGLATKFDMDDFYQEFFAMGAANGKNYVIPRSCDTVVTFYNKEIFQKAGVDMTTVENGWSWNEFMDACAACRTWMDANGMRNDYVIDANLTTWLSTCYPMLLSYGAEVLDANGDIAIDSAATRACLEMVKEMVENRYINDSSVQTTGSFENAHSAMLFQSASVSLYAEKKALKYKEEDVRDLNLTDEEKASLVGTPKIDLVSFPLINEVGAPKIGAGVAGYAINAESENKELAWMFLAHLLSYDGQQNMALNGLNLASIRKDLSDPATANWGKQYSSLNLAAYTYGSQYKVSTDFFTRTSLSAKSGLDQALVQMFTNATNMTKAADIDGIIDSAVRDMEYAMIEY